MIIASQQIFMLIWKRELPLWWFPFFNVFFEKNCCKKSNLTNYPLLCALKVNGF